MLGIRRGTIAAVDDPEKMFRYKVRVDGLHYSSTPAEALRWAESCTAFSAFGAGDVPHYEIGDRVWVGFENNDLSQPVIMGGWIAKRSGLSDVPTDVTQDYENSRRKWTRIDRIGNVIEMSEIPGERQIRVKSGKAELVVTQRDDSISLTALGEVRVKAGRATVTADEASVSSGNILLSALKDGDGKITLVADSDINLHVNDGGNAINIGQHMDEGAITAGGIPAPRQTPKVTVFAAEVEIGQYDSGTLLPTTKVTIAAQAEVIVKSTTKLTIDAPDVKVTGDVEITGDLDVTGDAAVTGDADVTGTVTGATDVKGGLLNVSLSQHTHNYTDTPVGPSVTQMPNP